jgi:hypothetical protein
MPEILFVPADGLGRTTAEDRKLIRSHCMLGKNKKKYKYKKNPEDRRDIGQQPRTDAAVSDNAACASETRSQNGAAIEYSLSSPVGTPSVFSLATFAREIDNVSRQLLFKCLLSSSFFLFPYSSVPRRPDTGTALGATVTSV